MRRFKLIKHLAFPADLYSGAPGKPGDVVELADEQCRMFGRFLAGRARAGDLVELDTSAPPSAPEPPTVTTTLTEPAKE